MKINFNGLERFVEFLFCNDTTTDFYFITQTNYIMFSSRDELKIIHDKNNYPLKKYGKQFIQICHTLNHESCSIAN